MEPNNQDFKVRLRAVEPEDVDKMYIWENDREIWPFGGTHAPMSRHQLWEYANNYDANPFSSGQLRLIIEISGKDEGKEACGTADLYDIDAVNSRAMTGIMVAPEWRRKGIAAKALKLLETYCRDTLGLAILASEVASDNLPSINLFGKKGGFILVGRRPSWFKRGNGFISAVLFQKKLTDFDD